MVEKTQAIIASNVSYRVTAKEQKESEPGFAKFGIVMINEGNENMADKVMAAGLAVKKQPMASGASSGIRLVVFKSE